MFSRPRKLDTEERIVRRGTACADASQAHSVHEMKQKLARRTDNELLVRVVIARLKENGQLDDERYAQQFTRNRTQSRKQGQFRIARELRTRGVSDRLINSALEESARCKVDPAAMVRQHIARKLKSYQRPQKCRKGLDDKKIASIYGVAAASRFPLLTSSAKSFHRIHPRTRARSGRSLGVPVAAAFAPRRAFRGEEAGGGPRLGTAE